MAAKVYQLPVFSPEFFHSDGDRARFGPFVVVVFPASPERLSFWV
jgi:hypothetical protein